MNVVGYYETITVALGRETGASDGLLHVHAGMALLLIARLVIGRSLVTATPFLVVFAFALGNEVLDRINYGRWDWPDALSDVAATLFWPFVLTLGVWIERSRERRRRSAQSGVRASSAR